MQAAYEVECAAVREAHAADLDKARAYNASIWAKVQVARVAQAELARVQVRGPPWSPRLSFPPPRGTSVAYGRMRVACMLVMTVWQPHTPQWAASIMRSMMPS